MQWLNDRIQKRPSHDVVTAWWCSSASKKYFPRHLEDFTPAPSTVFLRNLWSRGGWGGGGLSSFCAWLQTVSSKLKPTGGSEDFTSSSLHDYPMLRIGFQPQPNVSNTKSNLINLNELDASGRWQVKGYASKTWNDHSKYLDSHQSSKLIWWDKEKR